MERGMWVYPWDLLDGGIEPVIRRLAGAGINSLSVTTLYHNGRFLLPKRSRRKACLTTPGVAYFTTDQDRYPLGWAPAQDTEAERENLFPRVRAACTERGMQLRAWTVGFHDQPRPGQKIINVFGDEYEYALCPAAPANQAYLHALVEDVTATGLFDVIDLESYGFHGVRHFHHHERDALQLGSLEVYLLSLCFCNSCMDRSQARGIDAEVVRATVEAFLTRRLALDGPGEGPHGLWQLTSFLIHNPQVYAYTRSALATVQDLLRSLRSAMPPDVQLGITSATFWQPTAAAWQEGLDLRPDLWDVVDRLVLLAYFREPKDLHDELHFVLDSTDNHPSQVVMGQSLFPAESPSLPNVLTKLEVAKELGLDKICLYNYGFLNEERMRWLEPICRAWD